MGIPSLGSGAFPSAAHIFVPDPASIGPYRSAPGWSAFSARIKAEYDVNPSDDYYIASDVPYTEITRDYYGYYGPPRVNNLTFTFESSGIKTLYYAVDGYYGYNVYDAQSNYLGCTYVNYPNDGSFSFYANAGETYTLRFWNDSDYVSGEGLLSVINSPEYIPIVFYSTMGFTRILDGGPNPNVHLILFDAEIGSYGGWGYFEFQFTSTSNMTVHMHQYDLMNIMSYANYTQANNPVTLSVYIDYLNPVYTAIYIYTETPDTPVTLTVRHLY